MCLRKAGLREVEKDAGSNHDLWNHLVYHFLPFGKNRVIFIHYESLSEDTLLWAQKCSSQGPVHKAEALVT